MILPRNDLASKPQFENVENILIFLPTVLFWQQNSKKGWQSDEEKDF